jgi:hypothetical protein
MLEQLDLTRSGLLDADYDALSKTQPKWRINH